MLIDSLKDKEPLIRIEAASFLIKLGDKRGIFTLEEEFKSKNKKVGKLEASALEDKGDKKIIPFLKEALKEKEAGFFYTSRLV